MTSPTPRTRPVWLPTLKQLLLLFLGIILPLLLAGEIAEEVLEHERFAFEQPLMQWLHVHAPLWFLHLSLALDWLGKPLHATALCALLACWQWWRHHRARALFVALGTGLAALIMFTAKAFFQRPRPELWPRITEAGGASFPSGHSTFSAALAVIFIILYWQTPHRRTVIILATAFALLMGISRVVLGVHYPSDVLVGWLTGIASVIGIRLLMQQRLHPKP